MDLCEMRTAQMSKNSLVRNAFVDLCDGVLKDPHRRTNHTHQTTVRRTNIAQTAQ
jgi:hypothetical protein